MAILSDIRKRPIFLILIIGLALFAFVLSSVLKGNGDPSRKNIGEVNGESISPQEFARYVDAQKSRGGSTMQTVNQVWNQLIREKIYNEQINKAGIIVGEKDLWDAIVDIYKNSPNFQNEAGLFDESKLKEYIATLKENPNTWKNWEDNLENIKNNIKQNTYDDLIQSGLTASLKDGEREYYQNNKKYNIKFAYEPYSSIKDEEAKITDQEIKTYIKKNPKQFKVDPYTEIEFVKFDVKPSEEDIKAVKLEVTKLINDHEEYNENIKQNIKIEGFKNVKDNESFVNEFSDIAYNDKTYFKEDLNEKTYDTLNKLPINSIYGPIKEGDYFKLYKKLKNEDVKSVKASHILFSYKGAQSAKPTVTRTKEEAETEAKKLLKKVNTENFSDMAKKYSDGPSASKGGSLGDFGRKGRFVKEFDEFIFNNPKGKIGIVETPFGFHIIKVDDVKTDKGLKLAIVARKIDPSTKTESEIYQKAETLASDLENGKKLDELAKSNNYQIKKATNITKLSENVNGLGNEREIVKWTFDNENNVGAVKRFDLTDGNYAVVVLKGRYDKGLSSVAKAKSKVEPTLIKEKKAKIIRDKIKGSTLKEKAKSLGKSVLSANEVSIINPNLKIGGNDETVAAALLYTKEGDLKVIDGKNGVYVIEVIKVIEPVDVKKYSTFSNNLTQKLKSKTNKVFNALKENSEIEDNRADFY
jgi:peptidylprolyl isomerase/peptidyl-prolyl cis-trans isomerase D